MKKILVIIILGIVVSGGFFIVRQFPEEQILQSNQAEPEQNEEKAQPRDILDIVENESATETAPLLAVDGGNGSGAGYRLMKDGMLYYAIVAAMPDPREGSMYEGWFSRADSLELFSTGTMERNEDGLWVSGYSLPGEFLEFSRVMVTEEVVVDGIQERHILEGTF